MTWVVISLMNVGDAEALTWGPPSTPMGTKGSLAKLSSLSIVNSRISSRYAVGIPFAWLALNELTQSSSLSKASHVENPLCLKPSSRPPGPQNRLSIGKWPLCGFFGTSSDFRLAVRRRVWRAQVDVDRALSLAAASTCLRSCSFNLTITCVSRIGSLGLLLSLANRIAMLLALPTFQKKKVCVVR